jgi:2-C-methyl-D-erythritol 4-phosphate cytidylyltransferase
VVGVRPVTDTVKRLEEGYVGATVDRDALARVVSPVVVPARLLEDPALDDLSVDLADLVTRLGGQGRVLLVEAPPEAMRVSDAEDLRVLEALTRPS